MRRLLIILIFLFTPLLTTSVLGAGSYPDWVLPELNKYPIEKYVFDVGRSNGTGEEPFKEAIAKASKKVSEKILRQVIGIIILNKSNVNYQSVLEHYSAVLEDYCSWHLSSPALQLEGLEFRNLSLENPRTENDTFAVVFIERNKLRQIYKEHAANLKNEIKRRLKIAKSAEDDLNIDQAIRAYFQTYPLYESLKEAEIIQIGAEYKPNYHQTFTQLAVSATKRHGNLLPHRKVLDRVEDLEDKTIVNFHDIVRLVDSQLLKQLAHPNHPIAVQPVVFEDSEMISPFAMMFTQTLIQGMPEWVFVDPMLELEQPPLDINRINKDFPQLRLSSSCWENGEAVTIRVTLRNINTGDFLASSVVEFMKTNMRDNITYQPRGYEEAQKEKEVFHPLYIVSEPTRSNTDTTKTKDLTQYEFSPIGGLKVDIWTNKGRGPLSYTEDDMVTVYARVNQPAYLRLLNTHVNQKRALLADNFPIGPEDVNKDVMIGKFMCSPPFGVEFLNVAARTEKFPDIEIFEEDGYRYLIEKNPEKAIEQFRGLKPIPKQKNEKHFIGPKPIIDEQPNFQQNEAQLVITTMEK